MDQDRAIDIYENNPVFRFLVQIAGGFVPAISAFDDALRTRIDNIQADRLKTFFDALEDGKIELTESIIESEDFLHAYFSTVKAAVNTRRREKIRMFASLFKNYASNIETRDINEYEDWLSLLDDISYREFGVLMTLYHYEQKYPIAEAESDLDWYTMFWQDFVDNVCSRYSILPDELSGVLARLTRTGLYGNYPPDSGRVFGALYLDSSARLTPRFGMFIDVLGQVDHNLTTDSL